jgi:hypothetical protein
MPPLPPRPNEKGVLAAGRAGEKGILRSTKVLTVLQCREKGVLPFASEFPLNFSYTEHSLDQLKRCL